MIKFIILILVLLYSGCGDVDRSKFVKEQPIKDKPDARDNIVKKPTIDKTLDSKSIELWGAKCGKENRQITTKAFKQAKDYNGSVILSKECSYYLDTNNTLELKWKSLNGNHAEIIFLNNIQGNGIVFSDIKSLNNVVFNGNDKAFSKNRDTFMVDIKSDDVMIESCSFINIEGDSSDQYALGIDWNTNSNINNCLFKQITTHTNIYNTGGFTGGIFITDDQSFRVDRKTLKASIHKITNTTFENIYTRKQIDGNEIYPDSDGIRNYSYGYTNYDKNELENLKNSQFIIDNCLFKNVLKSGIKLNYSTIRVSNSRFVVDNLYEQDSEVCQGQWCSNVYSGFRFQTGDMDVNLKNLEIIGDDIRFGIIYTGNGNLKVDNVLFNSTYLTATEFLLGGYKDNYTKNIDINNSTSNRGIALLRNINNITFENISNSENNSTLFTFLSSNKNKSWDIDNLSIKGSNLHGKIDIYDPNKKISINKLQILNTKGITKDKFDDSLTIVEDEIHESFDKHVEYFEKQIKIRLPHTSYVLYDVQTFLQNAAIYADEKNDIYMLNKLLNLVTIPLEQVYITDGKWVEKEDAAAYNGNKNYINREVELCVAQYFSLLTRVLSACERNGIDTKLSSNDKYIIEEHINSWNSKWLNNWENRFSNELKNKNIQIKYDDREGFFVMSTLQYYDYIRKTNQQKADKIYDNYNIFLTTYMKEKADKAWSSEIVNIGDNEYDLAYFAKDNTINYYTSIPNEHAWSAYGTEIKDIGSDTDPTSMFYADGTIKQPAKEPRTYSDDISHGRRYVWFFESIKRFGYLFDLSIDKKNLIGFSNTLAYKVCRGTLKDPTFTIYVDGVDGWYRVGYASRKFFGYSVGEMDLSFVGSSYGMMGVYNPKIYAWMDAWVKKYPSRLDGYYGAYALDFYTSKAIDINKELKR